MEDGTALGGMRNPAQSSARLTRAAMVGGIVRELIDTAVETHPELKRTAQDILSGREEIRPLPEEAMGRLSEALRKLIGPTTELPEPTARAKTPLQAWVFAGWAEYSDDPDAGTLTQWLLHGAPLGFDEPITRRGVFPPSTGTRADAPTDAELSREAQGWENWPSANEEAEELSKLVRAAEQSGFCRLETDEGAVRAELGDVFLNKLGVIVKHKGGVKKGRIIWDLRESKVNQRCDQAERVILPKLLDAVHDCLHLIREDEDPILVAVDIQDAFHNIPAGADKRYTVAAADVDGTRQFIIYDVLVFGSRSSPTIWGRFAAFLGRTLAAVVPEQRCQVYVDDPILAIPNSGAETAASTLTAALVWMALAGYPVKLPKAKAGRTVEWIGAQIAIMSNRAVRVSIPREKLEALRETTASFLDSTVIGVRQLRSYAGGLSFVAGLVPVLRPFLAPLWSALADSASEGRVGTRTSFKSRTARQLIHTKRIAVALKWIRALLAGEHGDMVRDFAAEVTTTGMSIATDACPWGIGGVLYENHAPVRWFASPLTEDVLAKFQAETGVPGFNTLWEALALLVACRLWLPKASRKLSWRVQSDNVGALRMLLTLGTKSGQLAVVAREVALDLASQNYALTELQHVQGITNVAPDALSRQWAPEPEPFPSLGKAVQDPVPRLDSTFWRCS